MTCHGCVGGMNCCGAGAGGYHRFFLLRLVLGILILVIVFSLGVKIGEFKGMFDRGYQEHRIIRMPMQSSSTDDTIEYRALQQ